MADKLAKLKDAALRLSNELWKVDTRAEAVSWCAAADEVLRAFAAAPRAPSGQQAEPTDLKALAIQCGGLALRDDKCIAMDIDDLAKFAAALAGQPSERPAPAGQAVGEAVAWLYEHRDLEVNPILSRNRWLVSNNGDGRRDWVETPLVRATPDTNEARGHTASSDCWCSPEVDYVDPDTGATVYVHRGPQ